MYRKSHFILRTSHPSLLAFTLILMLPFSLLQTACNTWAATYYVDATNGDDSNSGLSQSVPWRTVAKVNSSKYSPGDQILFKRGEVWRGCLTFPASGDAGNPITLGAFGVGVSPVFDGSEVMSLQYLESTGNWPVYCSSIIREPKQVFQNKARLRKVPDKNALQSGTWYWEPASKRVYLAPSGNAKPKDVILEASQRDYGIYLYDKHDIILEGLETRNANFCGIFLSGGTSRVSILRCRSQNNYQDGIKGWHPVKYQDSIVVHQCTVAYNGQDGVAVHQRNTNWNIDNNDVNNNCLLPDFTWSAGIKILSQTVSNIGVTANKVYLNGRDSNSYRGKGIWIDTAGRNIEVARNVVYNNSTNGIEIESSSDVLVAYNLVYNHPARYGIYVKAGLGFPAIRNRIYNNTIFGANVGIKCEGTNSVNSFVNNEFKNNISVGNAIQLATWGGAENDGVNGQDNVFLNNCFGRERSGFIEWPSGTSKSTYKAWAVAYGGETFSVPSDPQFVDPVKQNFALRFSSPCIASGSKVGLSADISGKALPKKKNPDIGAFQW